MQTTIYQSKGDHHSYVISKCTKFFYYILSLQFVPGEVILVTLCCLQNVCPM